MLAEDRAVCRHQFAGQDRQRTPACLVAGEQELQQLRREAGRRRAGNRRRGAVGIADLVTAITDVRHDEVGFSGEEVRQLRPIGIRCERTVDAGDLHRLVDDRIATIALDANRKTARPTERGDTAGAFAAPGRLDDRDRPDVLPALARLVNEQVDMRLEEAAGAELDDASCHLRNSVVQETSMSALIRPRFSVAQRARSPMAPASVVR